MLLMALHCRRLLICFDGLEDAGSFGPRVEAYLVQLAETQRVVLTSQDPLSPVLEQRSRRRASNATTRSETIAHADGNATSHPNVQVNGNRGVYF